MRQTTKTRAGRLVALLGASALVLGACNGDDVADPGQEETQTEALQQSPTDEQPPTDDGSPTGEDTEGLEDIQTGQTPGATEGPGYTVELQELNGSAASGIATVAQEADGQVTVTVNTSNVAADAPHAQHLHIGGSNECPPADAAGDDQVISTEEGAEFYGEIAVSLTTEGDVGPESALAVERFPVANEDGEVSYVRTFELPEDMTLDDLADAVLVQHGVADTPLGEDPATYDGPDSPLAEGVPQEATLPALCGPLSPSE